MKTPAAWDSNPDFYPILPWGPVPDRDPAEGGAEAALAGIAACHFTVGGFVNPAYVSACGELGLQAIVHPTIAGIGTWGKAWNELSDEEIRERIRALVEEAGDSDAILGYFLRDEPSVHDFPALAKAVAAVKEYAPGKLAYINLFPDYAVLGDGDIARLGTDDYTEYLERFVEEVRPQFLSYDNYSVLYSNDMEEKRRAASYYRNLLEVRRVALERGIPFWNIVSSNQIRPFTPIPSPANLAFQAYTTLAAGGRGISWYTYFVRGYDYAPIDGAGKRTETWYHLREVNREVKTLGPIMNRLVSTGVFFSHPPPVEGLPVLPGNLIRSVEASGPVMVGEFRSEGGGGYAMLVNLSLAGSVRVRFEAVNGRPAADVISGADGRRVPYEPEKGRWLAAGRGILLRLGEGSP